MGVPKLSGGEILPEEIHFSVFFYWFSFSLCIFVFSFVWFNAFRSNIFVVSICASEYGVVSFEYIFADVLKANKAMPPKGG